MRYIPRIFGQIVLLSCFVLSISTHAGADQQPVIATSAVSGANVPSITASEGRSIGSGIFSSARPANANFNGELNIMDKIFWLLGLGGLGIGLALFWLLRRSRMAATKLEPPRRVVPASIASSASTNEPRDQGGVGVDGSQYWVPLDQATTITVDELSNVEEEAEYFLLLGRMDMAIGVLRHYLLENEDAPARIWLGLLDILHSQGLRQEFDKLVVEIRKRFNVSLPSWEQANARSHALTGLEHFPNLFAKITSNWNKRGCLDYLRSLTQDNRNGQRDGFNLEAFREILVLIDVLEYKKSIAEQPVSAA